MSKITDRFLKVYPSNVLNVCASTWEVKPLREWALNELRAHRHTFNNGRDFTLPAMDKEPLIAEAKALKDILELPDVFLEHYIIIPRKWLKYAINKATKAEIIVLLCICLRRVRKTKRANLKWSMLQRGFGFSKDTINRVFKKLLNQGFIIKAELKHWHKWRVGEGYYIKKNIEH